ncbi:MAG TPA: sulfotransferase [Steroidobacteraceae bacterium]|nr:sulfotransferase [Steroidobacteraceae bacterium]
MQPRPPPRLQQVLEALQRFDRRRVAALVAEELREGPASGEHWGNVEAVANRIGEIELALEAARRFALTEPRSLERALHYCNALVARGRLEESLRELDRLPSSVQQHAAVLSLRGAIATQRGEFTRSEALLRDALAREPQWGPFWLALSEVHRFSPGDADLARLETLAPQMRAAPAHSQAPFFYALGKAWHDCREYDRAFAAYAEGAAQMRAPFDAGALERFVRDVIHDFTPQNLARLAPSGCDSERAIFVTGLPRSGTTLVEQILASHSAVASGEEANLFCNALIPAGDFTLRGGLDYQQRGASPDPWGEIGRDYLAMLDQRFGRDGRIVDKTLNHSRFLGFILQSLPRARVIWLRRDAADTAISCFRSFFGTGTIPWCWSLGDIGWHFRLEDALHAHWSSIYPDRILTVPYEALVTDPRPWITRMLAHVGLAVEPAVFAPHLTQRAVQTVSVAQVRQPISTGSIGAAGKYGAHLRPFHETYGS